MFDHIGDGVGDLVASPGVAGRCAHVTIQAKDRSAACLNPWEAEHGMRT